MFSIYNLLIVFWSISPSIIFDLEIQGLRNVNKSDLTTQLLIEETDNERSSVYNWNWNSARALIIFSFPLFGCCQYSSYERDVAGEAVFAECKKRFALWRLFWEKSQAPLFSCCFACHRFCRTFSSPEVCCLAAGPLREQNSCRKRIDIRPLLNLTLSFFGVSVGILKISEWNKSK